MLGRRLPYGIERRAAGGMMSGHRQCRMVKRLLSEVESESVAVDSRRKSGAARRGTGRQWRVSAARLRPQQAAESFT